MAKKNKKRTEARTSPGSDHRLLEALKAFFPGKLIWLSFVAFIKRVTLIEEHRAAKSIENLNGLIEAFDRVCDCLAARGVSRDRIEDIAYQYLFDLVEATRDAHLFRTKTRETSSEEFKRLLEDVQSSDDDAHELSPTAHQRETASISEPDEKRS